MSMKEGRRDAVYLTTTAEGYFARHGFGAIDRATVPPAIRSSAEFSTLCPTTAVVMRSTPTTAAEPAEPTGGHR